ncbi:hypothetical protein ACFFX0_04255 [Citricoccus parietis]|uniref:Uncharacterized protein n=1 Tax=Citricoccus parietis TaxID=592307 RepID=A0ABV5FUS7_9MICC
MARSAVSGINRLPSPPASTTASTFFCGICSVPFPWRSVRAFTLTGVLRTRLR